MEVTVFGNHVRILTSCIIIRTLYITLDKLYIIIESDKLQLHYL